MDGFFHAFDACLLALAHGACWVEALFLISTCAPFVAPLFIRCFCCTLACRIWSDTFTTNTIADYDQRVGSWSIASGKISITGTGLIIANTTLRDDIGQVAVRVVGPVTNDIIAVVGAYTDDDNYLMAKLECTNDLIPSFKCHLVERVGGVETTLVSDVILSYNLSVSYLIKLCWNGTHASIIDPGLTTAACYAETTLVGNKVGIRVLTTAGTSSFDDLTADDNYENVTSCPACDLHCNTACTKHTSTVQVQLDVTGVADGGVCVSGCGVFNNTWIADLRQDGTCRFVADVAPSVGSCGTAAIQFLWSSTNRVDMLGVGSCVLTGTGGTGQDCGAVPAAIDTQLGSCVGCDISGATVTITPL